MDDDISTVQVDSRSEEKIQQHEEDQAEIIKLKAHFQSRIIAANLRTEAVRAGMIDLDGLKLLDVASVHLDDADNIVGGQTIMTNLRRNKPWLFGAASSSSASVVPASQPVRQKTALEMTEQEYIAARNAVTKY
jgi:hypothetical protein